MVKNVKGCFYLKQPSGKKELLFWGNMILVLFLFFCSFLFIANELSKDVLLQFDGYVIYLVQSKISPVLIHIMMVITFFGSVRWFYIVVITGVTFLFIYKKWSLGIFLAGSSSLGGLCNSFLKNLFKRQRPDFNQLITEQGYSFPSGHSMGSFIIYGALAYIIIHSTQKKKWKFLGVLIVSFLIVGIGLSRIYLGVHFPSDIVGGFMAGGAWLTICIIFFRFYESKRNL